MKITIKKLTDPNDIQLFWAQKRAYEERDIFPDLVETGAERQEIIDWFKSQEYYDLIMELHHKPHGGGSPLAFVFFMKENQEQMGFAMYKIYTQEDGKGFILDFCIQPDQRNRGIGALAFQALESHMREEGAIYTALNASNERNARFWQQIGFLPEADPDEHGEIVYVKR